MDDSQAHHTKATGKLKQAVQHAPNVPPFIQQEVASGNKIGVLFVSYRSRRLDRDNLVGAGKGAVDALRYCGYLADDDPDRVEVFYLQRLCKRIEERTELYLFNLCQKSKSK